MQKTKAKKSLGQNFLRDPKILMKIAEAAQIEKEDTVLEIGPGEGTLTEILLEKAGKVIAVEKDRELVEKLKERWKDLKMERLEIINADILEYEPKVSKYKLVGNIPYYITGEIFRKFLESENQPESMTLVVQREVADRIVARDGKESVLSISIKAYGKPEYGGLIKAGSFSPQPKVDSAIISVRNISKSRFNLDKIDEKRFFQILKKGFAHKRKFLISNLGLSKGIFDKLGLDQRVRAEDITVNDWFQLASIL